VIGNPPYVRMEFIKPFKPYLEKNYVVADDRTDLYAYFFEQGIRILKDRGRLGYISSSTFFRTGSGGNLRTFLGDNVAIEAIIDFGDLQIFEGVTTYPAILTLHKGSDAEGTLSFMKIDDALPKDLGAAFVERSLAMPRSRLGSGSWQLESDALAELRNKIVSDRKTLGDVYGAPLYGIKTGFNEAFVIDTPTRNRLVKQDRKSAELLKPFLRGENIKRWRVEPEGLFLINTPRGDVDIEKYPAIRDWLLPFKVELEKRATKQEWWELQQAQLAYQPAMSRAKIVYPEFSQGPKFCLEDEGLFLSNKCFFVEGEHQELLALLNSRLMWFWMFGEASPLRGGQWRLELREQYISQVPIPNFGVGQKLIVGTLAKKCTLKHRQSLELRSAVCHRILTDIAPPDQQKLTGKLERFWMLDFSGFRSEVKKAFEIEIPVKGRDSWEKYLAEKSAEVIRLAAEIETAEREIDTVVYKLFNLTDEEVKLLEASLEGQY